MLQNQSRETVSPGTSDTLEQRLTGDFLSDVGKSLMNSRRMVCYLSGSQAIFTGRARLSLGAAALTFVRLTSK